MTHTQQPQSEREQRISGNMQFAFGAVALCVITAIGVVPILTACSKKGINP